MEKKQNGLGVAGFVLSLIGCTSFLGLIFSIIALATGKEKKKGLAIAGLVIGIVWVLIGAIFVSTMSAPDSSISEESKNMSESDFKSSCKNIKYDDLFRNIKEYDGEKVHVKGKINQVVSDGEKESIYMVAITKGEYETWTDIVYVVLDRSNYKDKLLEGDIVDFYGECNGTKTYTTVLGAGNEVPKISALYAKLN